MKHIPEDQAEVASISNQVMRRFANRKTTIMRNFSWPLRSKQLAQQCLMILVVFSSIQLLLPFNAVNCQDFEDLTSKQLGNHQLAQHSFQPQHSNRQPQQQSSSSSSSSSTTTTTRQRPILSSRFAPSYTGSSNSAVNSAGNQQLLAQASSSANVFSAPPSAISQLQQQQQQLQQSSPASAAGSSGTNGGSGSVSNIEQLMKNALARTAQMNSAAAVEPRQETGSISGNINAPAQSEQPAPVQSLSRSSQSAQQVQQQAALREADKSAESSNTAPDSASASDDESKQTTASGQATTASGHETVYSDQRFANLFARRNSAKKSRITPAEQVKAKPTLPSFIKSLPDPKQFSAAQAAASAAEKPPTSASSSSFASQRLQQANQNRINQANQQKKAVITSTSAANASNKRANALNGKQVSSTASPKVTSANQKSTTNKPVVTPSSNNPFNRSQSSNSDPANVIAMARKRLLANNALETAKLKQQQSKPAN